MAQTASVLLVERLIDWGVDTVFGLPGDAINGFFEALRKTLDRPASCTSATRRWRPWPPAATPSSRAAWACASPPSPLAPSIGSAGLVGTRPSSKALEGCDALHMVGTSFPYIEHLPKPGQAAAVQIDVDPAHIGLRYPVDVGLAGDAKATLRELLPLLPRNDDRAFLEQAQAGMRDWWRLMEQRGTREDMPMMWCNSPILSLVQRRAPTKAGVRQADEGA